MPIAADFAVVNSSLAREFFPIMMIGNEANTRDRKGVTTWCASDAANDVRRVT